MNLDENLESKPKEIKIKIRTIDNINNELVITINKDETIKALKEQISLVIIIIIIIILFYSLILEIPYSNRKTKINI